MRGAGMSAPPESEPETTHGLPAPIAGHDVGASSTTATGSTTAPVKEPPLLDTERIPPRAEERAPRIGATRAAWAVALTADAIQWIVWPLFIAGAASPFDAIVDVVVAGLLTRLLGWHWVFLPSFAAKLIPGVDLVPTWTAAVFLATRGRGRR
jgi:hypothetical protein